MSILSLKLDLVNIPWYCRVLNVPYALKISTRTIIDPRSNITMDYNFYGASQQPYHYMGMPTNAFANTGIDPEAMHSAVSFLP